MTEVLPHELALVDAALRRHPRASSFRLSTQGGRIEVFERRAPDLAAMLSGLGLGGAPDGPPGIALALCFVLDDPERRLFRIEARRTPGGPLEPLPDRGDLRALIPRALALL